MSSVHKERWIEEADPIAKVPCRQWVTLFKGRGIQHVDMFSLDVEGAEYSVLSVMDWTVSVDYFIIEITDSSKDDARRGIFELLASKGYEPVDWQISDWCIPGADCSRNTVFKHNTTSPRLGAGKGSWGLGCLFRYYMYFL